MNIQDIAIIANGQWESIFNSLGIVVPENKKHGACPICGGKDRFRFDNKDNRGSYFCNQCGAGNGFDLVSKSLNLSVIDTKNLLADNLGLSNGQPINKQALAQAQNRIDEHTKQQNKLQKLARESACKEALKRFDEASTTITNPYLQNKQVNAYDIYQLGSDLFLPIFHLASGVLVNAQTIKPNGDKRFLKGGLVKGCVHVMGEVVTNPVLIAEGYATGATLHELTGLTTFICFNAGNIYPAVQILHSYLSIVICADNDSHLENNVGINKAVKAATDFNCRAVAPDEQGDFNDLMLAKGKGAVINCLNEVLEVRVAS